MAYGGDDGSYENHATCGIEMEFFQPRQLPGAQDPYPDKTRPVEVVVAVDMEDSASRLSKLRHQLRFAYREKRKPAKAEENRLYNNELLISLDKATRKQMNDLVDLLQNYVDIQQVPNGHLQGKALGALRKDKVYQGYSQWILSREESHNWYERGHGSRCDFYPTLHTESYDWLGLELASPVFNGGDLGEARAQIQKVCSSLRNRFRVSVNIGKPPRASGLHVHWGLQHLANNTQALLPVVKRLVTIMWVVEGRLMELHASWRGDKVMERYAGLLQLESTLAVSRTNPRQHHLLGSGWAENVPVMLQNDVKIQHIWKTKSVSGLVRLATPPKRVKGALALLELVHSRHTLKKSLTIRKTQLNTVEFRHMQGSLEPDHILAWVMVTKAIMKLAVEGQVGSMRYIEVLDAANRICGQKPFSMQSLLGCLGVSQAAKDFFSGIAQEELDRAGNPQLSGPFLEPLCLSPTHE